MQIERRNTGSSCRNQIHFSKLLSTKWRKMTEIQKQPFVDEAERLRFLHVLQYPHFKFASRKQRKFSPCKLLENHHLVVDEQSGVCCQ